MRLDDGRYISWWPQYGVREGSSGNHKIFTVDAILDRTFENDYDDEGGRLPDETIEIKNGLRRVGDREVVACV